MNVGFDPPKRAATLAERGLDFADAGLIFEGDTVTFQDTRVQYGEQRFITAGYLRDRFVVTVWTPRRGKRHTISMRHGHGKEERIYFP